MEGFIVKAISNDFHVFSPLTEKTYICKARGQFRNHNITPLCGDYVDFSFDVASDFGLINEIKKRKNELIRPPIANVDVALIVMSTIKPDFDSYLVDKLIVCTTLQNIEPILIVSKCEFITEEVDSLVKNYQLAGYTVIYTSVKENIHIDKVIEAIRGKKVVLCGQSAVGKSSLINALSDNCVRSVGDYSEKLGRGRHETREVEFMNIHESFIADTPGFSRLDIKEDLTVIARTFKDFNHYAASCKYATCIHQHEPECGVKKALENGLIDPRRYTNYLHLINEIKDGKKIWRKK